MIFDKSERVARSRLSRLVARQQPQVGHHRRAFTECLFRFALAGAVPRDVFLDGLHARIGAIFLNELGRVSSCAQASPAGRALREEG